MTFLARIQTDYSVFANAIACDEYTSVCIDTNGIACVFGGYPTYDDNAYFIQSNCELALQTPENCTTGNSLTWNLGGVAIKAYQIKGDSTGSKTFNLNTWQSGTGGTWYNWSVSNGIFSEQTGTVINCAPLSVHNPSFESEIDIFPNPTTDKLTIAINNNNYLRNEISIYNNLGQRLFASTTKVDNAFVIDFSNFNNGLYLIIIDGKDGKVYHSKIIKQ